jgi:hypothetical protein
MDASCEGVKRKRLSENLEWDEDKEGFLLAVFEKQSLGDWQRLKATSMQFRCSSDDAFCCFPYSANKKSVISVDSIPDPAPSIRSTSPDFLFLLDISII